MLKLFVLGGTSKYEEAFLAEEYLEMNPSDVQCVENLKNLLADQIPLLEVALSVHKSKVASNMIPLHERLEECFLKMQNHVESKYGKRTTDLKFERDATVVLRKAAVLSVIPISGDNRLSETSMGSSE